MHLKINGLACSAILMSILGTSCVSRDNLLSDQSPGLPMFLVGCHETSDQKTREIWTYSSAGKSNNFLNGQGFSRTDTGDVPSETMRIEVGKSGLVFVAIPNGKTETVFHQTDRRQDEITFSNPEHDYPQRITYSRTDDALIARISMENASKPMEWRFHPCPAD